MLKDDTPSNRKQLKGTITDRNDLLSLTFTLCCHLVGLCGPERKWCIPTSFEEIHQRWASSLMDFSNSQPASHSHSLSLHTGQGNKARGEALYDLPQRLEVSTASPSVIYHLGCGDKCFKESSIHSTKEALAYISLPSLLCQIWSVVWSPGNMIRRRSVAWSATRVSVCVDEDTTAGYVVTLSANSARLSSLSTKPVRAWKFLFC